MKRVLSVLLVLLLAVSCVQLAIAVEAPNGLLFPTVYIRGKTDVIYTDIGTADEFMVSDSSRVFSKEITDVKTYALDKAKELLPLFAVALVSKDYSLWAEKMSKILEPIYTDFVMDKSGKPRPNSGVKFNYTQTVNKADANGYYNKTELYPFPYDWRMSPLDVADQLEIYIDAVLAATGINKVNLVTRCEGSCVALAYFYEYGSDKIANNMMLGSSATGVVYASNIFAGKFDLNADAVNRYIGRNFAASQTTPTVSATTFSGKTKCCALS